MGAADANVNSLSADDVALASVKPRIESAWPDAVSDDDFDTDAEGRAHSEGRRRRRSNEPPCSRKPGVPTRWRAWDSLLGRSPHNRHATKGRPRTPLARVGSMRRYVLLVLMLVQTGIATWYMKPSCLIRAGR